jgi:hypothetical protein
MNAPELIPATETCVGSAGKRPSGSAADAHPPNHADSASSNAPATRHKDGTAEAAGGGGRFTPESSAEP